MGKGGGDDTFTLPKHNAICGRSPVNGRKKGFLIICNCSWSCFCNIEDLICLQN